MGHKKVSEICMVLENYTFLQRERENDDETDRPTDRQQTETE